MIKEFVDAFEAAKPSLEACLKTKHPENYKDLVVMVVKTLSEIGTYYYPDSTRVHEIDDGKYQGTLVYVIAAEGYQPNKYWFVKVSYGSCSGCDTLQAISGYSSEPPTDEQVKDYMSLMLHIVQGLKELGD